MGVEDSEHHRRKNAYETFGSRNLMEQVTAARANSLSSVGSTTRVSSRRSLLSNGIVHLPRGQERENAPEDRVHTPPQMSYSLWAEEARTLRLKK